MITMKRFSASSNNIKIIMALLIFILGFIAIAPPGAHAAIPRYINYQGKLTDADDNPVTGDVSITIRIYDAESGGTALWTETQTVTVTRGIFSMLLGNATALTGLDFNSPYWYSIEVGSDGEMTPRQRVTSVAYAINADKLDGYDASQFLRADADTSLTGALTVSGSITGSANGDITLDPTGTGNIVMKIDSTSGDFKVTDGTTNYVLVDNATGNVTMSNDLTVSGTIYGAISSTGGSSTFSSLTVTGASDLRGNISNSGSGGAVTIADAITQTGSTNQVTLAGNLDANNGVDVTGALTVSGATTLSSALDMNSNIDLDYSGASAALDVTQSSTGPAAQFSGQRVVIGASEASNANALSTGELYVLGDLEVDGTLYANVSSSGDTSLGSTTLSSLTVTGTSNLQGNISNSTGTVTVADYLSVTQTDSSTSGTVVNTAIQPTYQDGGTNSTTTANALKIAPTINYTGATKTGSYTALKIVATETSLPTGTNYLIDAYAGTEGTTQKFYIDNSGNIKIFGTLDMNGQKIASLGTPTVATDAATKAYADSLTPATAGGWTDGGVAVYLLSSTDNVGIGTSNPGAALAVGADAFKVTSAGVVTAGTWNGTAITDAYVSNTLTASDLAAGSSVVSDAEVDDDITLTNVTQITNRSHTSLTDIGTNTHAQIDTHVSSTGTSVHGLGSMSTQASNNVSIAGGSITGITDLAVADGGTGASTAGDARTNLGLGSMSTQASNNVSIAGGSITGITDLAVADGGTGASTAGAALTNLGAAASSHTHGSGDITSGVVLTAPSSAQIIQPSADVVPLTIKGQASATSNVLSIYDAAASPSEKIYIDSAGHMYVAETTTGAAQNSSATMYFGRNSTDNWEVIGYDPTLGTKGKFTFSAPLQVEASSPTGITFIEKDADGVISKSQDFTYDPSADQFSFSGGVFAQQFKNLIKNSSFEAFSALETFHSLDSKYATGNFDTAMGGMRNTSFGYEGGWNNFEPDEWDWVGGDVFQNAPMSYKSGYNVAATTYTNDYTNGVSSVRIKDTNTANTGTGNDGELKQIISGLEPTKVYSVGIDIRVDPNTAAATKGIVDIVNEMNIAGLTLNGDLAQSTTTITITGDISKLPSNGFLWIEPNTSDAEQVSYTGKNVTNVSGVTRGINGTTARNHSSGAAISCAFRPLEATITNASSFNTFKGQFVTDEMASSVEIHLKAQSTSDDGGTVLFDSVQIVAGKSVPEYQSGTITDSGDQTIYGALRIGRASDDKGGILSVDKFVRTRGVEFFTDDPGFTGQKGGFSGFGGINPPVGPYNISGTVGSLSLFTSGDYTGSTQTMNFYVQITDSVSTPNKFKWYYNDGTGAGYVAGNNDAPINVSTNDIALGATGVKVRFSAAAGGTSGDRWDFFATQVDSVGGYNSYGTTTTYVPSGTRIFKDPDPWSPTYNELIFEDGTNRVSISSLISLAGEPSKIDPAYAEWNAGAINSGGLSVNTSGNYTGADEKFYKVQIVTTGTQGSSSGTFKWSSNGGIAWNPAGAPYISMSFDEQAIGTEGVRVKFLENPTAGDPPNRLSDAYITGGVAGDTWGFSVHPGSSAGITAHTHASENSGGVLDAALNMSESFTIDSTNQATSRSINFGSGQGAASIIWDRNLDKISINNDVDISGTLTATNLSGATSVSGTTNTTFGVDTDLAIDSTEPASGAGFSIEGGSGDVNLTYDTTNNLLNITGQTGPTNTFVGLNIPAGTMYKIGGLNLSAADVGAAVSGHGHAGSDITSGTVNAVRLPLAAVNTAGIIPATGLTNAMVSSNVNDAISWSKISKVGAVASDVGALAVETDPLALKIADADNIKDTHIDWGTGVNQVSTTDMTEGVNLYYTDVRVDSRLDSDQTISGNWIFSNNVTVPQTPIQSTDAASKSYVDAGIAGLSWKEAVLGLIENNTLVPPTENNGDRYVLSKTGGAPHANWDGAAAGDIVQFNGTSWVKRTPIDGDAVFVEDIDTGYVYTGTAWTPFTGTSAYTWGNGLGADGATINVGVTAPITVDASNVGLSYDATDFSLVNNALTITNTGIDHDALTNFVANEHIDWTNATNNIITSGSIQSGKAGTDGALKLYSEQGATDYTMTLAPNDAMTGDATIKLPAAIAGSESFLKMGNDGVIDYDTNVYLTTEVDGSTTNEINTITADAGGATTGLAITLAGGTGISTSRVNDTVTITNSLGASIESAEITDGAIVAGDIASSAITKQKLSELAPSADGSAKTISIAAGDIYVSGNTLKAASSATANFASGGNCVYDPVSSSKYIKGVIVMDSTGALSLVTDGSSEVDARATAEGHTLAYPSNKVPIAEVVLYTTGTGAGSIANIEAFGGAADTKSYIYRDVRPFLNLGVDSVFKTISVAGQTDVAADSPIDQLTLTAGDNITITTNADNDAITITAGGAIHNQNTDTGTTSQTFEIDSDAAAGAILSASGLTASDKTFTFPDVSGIITTTAATQTLTNKTLTTPKFSDLGYIADANGNEILILDTVATAVNELTIANAATAGKPTITATGTDDNISINIVPKGIGTVQVGGTAVSLSTHNHSGTYEPVIALGLNTQYWRGDKTWQTLDKSAVGLGNVDNIQQMPLSYLDSTTTLGTSDIKVPTQNAVKTYVDANIAGLSWKEAVLDLIENNTLVPPTETNGDRYILSKTGGAPHANWDGAGAGDIVQFNGTSWVKRTPIDGDAVFVEDVDTGYVYTGTAWTPFTGATAYTWGNGLANTSGIIVDVQVGNGIQISNDAVAAKESEIDHDLLKNFLTAEHVDWAAQNAGTIHASNYVDNINDSVSGAELDGVFSTTGLLKRTGAATYVSVTDSSANWDTAYTHSQDNSQAHSDYLLNNADDVMAGALTIATTTPSGLTIDNTTAGDINTVGNLASDSGSIILRGNFFTDATDTNTELDMSMNLDITDASTYKLSILDNTGTNEIASLNQAGGLQIDSSLTIGATSLTETNLIDLTDNGSTALHTHDGLVPGPHAVTHHSGGADEVYWASLERSNVDATSISSEIDSDISTHAALTATHGATGNIVGTSDTQTLTNKTLTNPLISQAYGSAVANGDISIDGTSDVTKTTSYVLLQSGGGLVGIGTTAPLEELHVMGQVKIADSSADTSDGYLYLGNDSHYLMWDDNYVGKDSQGQDVTGWMYTDIGMSVKNLEIRGASPATITFGSGATSKQLQFDSSTQEFSFTGGKMKQAFQNLVRGGSFESWNTPGWYSAWYSGGYTTTTYAKFGTKSLYMHDNSITQTAFKAYYISNWDRLKGSSVTLSVWARCDSGTATGSVGISTNASSVNATVVNNIALTTTWQNFSFIYNVPSNATSLKVYLYGSEGTNGAPDSSKTSTSAVYYDGVTLVEGKLALEYGPSPVFDTGDQVIGGSLAIGADIDPYNTGYGMNYYRYPRIVFGEPDVNFGGYYDAYSYGGYNYNTYSGGTGEISFRPLNTSSGTFTFNRPIGMDSYEMSTSSWRSPALFIGRLYDYSGGGTLDKPDYAWTTSDAYIKGVVEVDGGIYGDVMSFYGGVGKTSNLLTYSEDFTQGAWSKAPVGMQVVTSQSAPDGSTSACKLISAVDASVTQTISAANNTTYTFSVYIAPDTQNYAYIFLKSNVETEWWTWPNYQYVDLYNTTAWRRFSVTYTTPSSGVTSVSARIMFYGSSSYNSIKVWGAQLRQASAAGIYTRAVSSPIDSSTSLFHGDGSGLTNLSVTSLTEGTAPITGIAGNIFTLNEDLPVTDSPVANLSVAFNRGNQPTASILWNETSDNFIINNPVNISSGGLTVNGTITAGSGQNIITTSAGLLDATKLSGTVPTGNLPSDGYGSTYVNVSGDTMSGALNFSNVTADITTANNEHLALMPGGTGNVGIGTTAPAALLQIVKGAYGGSTPLVITNSTPSGAGDPRSVAIAFQNNNAGNFTGASITSYASGLATEGDLRFSTRSTTDAAPLIRMAVSTSGNVGIGTTVPNSKLEVNGDIGLWGSGTDVRGLMTANDTNGLIIRGGYNNLGGIILRTITGGTNQDRVTILNNGNVGIGTATPNQRLDVAGSINTTGLLVGGGYGNTGVTISSDGNIQIDGNIYYKGKIYQENVQELLVADHIITMNSGGSAQDAFIKVENTNGQIKWANASDAWQISNNNGANFYNILHSNSSFGGDVSGTASAIAVTDDSHLHTASTLPAATSYLGSSIGTVELEDSAITSAKINDGAIATADIADSAVTNAKIASGAVAKSNILELRPYATTPSPNNKVNVASGIISVSNNAKIEFAGAISDPFDPVTANSRIDLLTINSSGSLVIIPGIQAVSPDAPSYPTDKLVIAEVTITETAVQGVTITDGDIKDVRPFLNIGSGSGDSSITTTDSVVFTIGRDTDEASNDVTLAFGNTSSGQKTIIYQGASSDDFVFNDDISLGSNSLKFTANTLTGTKVGNYDSHLTSTSNPHSVTAAQVGGSSIVTEINAGSTLGTINTNRLASEILTQTEGDTAYVNVAGDTITGSLAVNGTLTPSIVSMPTEANITWGTAGKALLTAEYPNAIIYGDGSFNNGTMAVKNTGDSNWRNYYEWSSQNTILQDYIISVRYELPQDFSTWAVSDAIKLGYITQTALNADNKADVTIYKAGSASAIATTTANISTSWSEIVIDDSTLGSWNAGDILIIEIKLHSKNGNFVRIGDITLNYTR